MFNYLKWKLCFNGKLLAFTQPKWPNQLVVRIFGGQSTIRPLCYSLGQNLIRMAFTILTLKMVLATKSAFNETPLFIRFIWTILKTIANFVQGYTFTAIVTCYKMKLKLNIFNFTVTVRTPSHDHRFLQVLSHFCGFEPIPGRYFFFLKSDIKWAFSYILIH